MNSISELYQRRASGIRFGSTSLRHRDVTILAESKDAGIIPLVESHRERESESRVATDQLSTDNWLILWLGGTNLESVCGCLET